MSTLILSLSSLWEISTSMLLLVSTVKYLEISVKHRTTNTIVQIKETIDKHYKVVELIPKAPKKVGSVRSLGSFLKISSFTNYYFIFILIIIQIR